MGGGRRGSLGRGRIGQLFSELFEQRNGAKQEKKCRGIRETVNETQIRNMGLNPQKKMFQNVSLVMKSLAFSFEL